MMGAWQLAWLFVSFARLFSRALILVSSYLQRSQRSSFPVVSERMRAHL